MPRRLELSIRKLMFFELGVFLVKLPKIVVHT